LGNRADPASLALVASQGSGMTDKNLPLVRVLVVDDFEPFRQFVRPLLRKRLDLQVICEVSDGLEAVQKAVELKPELILLDVGLPTLNGIETARQIGKLVPESKIIFLSQEASVDVVQEALSLGAWGYVLKPRAASELLAAVEAVLQGKLFVSSGVADRVRPKEIFTSLVQSLPRKAKATRCHEVQFYSGNASLLDGFTRFIEAALRVGNAVIVVATDSHRNSLLQRLQVYRVDVFAAIEQGSYIPLDVADTLSTFMVNDMPDPVRFSKVVGDLIAIATKAAKGERPRVAACGECAPLLWAQGKAEAAIRLEQLWDEIARTYDVDILCGYPLSGVHRDENSHVFQRICAEHSAVYS
jgi:DNA-binding NarL/FixJ family response regulator